VIGPDHGIDGDVHGVTVASVFRTVEKVVAGGTMYDTAPLCENVGLSLEAIRCWCKCNPRTWKTDEILGKSL